MPHDILNEGNTTNWQGTEKKIYGIVHVNETAYSFLGTVPNTKKMIQKKVEISSFTTKYYFESNEINLIVEFISPLTPNNLELLSSPVCILKYQIIPKVDGLKTSLALFVHEHLAYNHEINPNSLMRGDVMKYQNFDVAYFGLDEQKILSHSADVIGADWGYYYLTGEKCYYTNEDGLDCYTKNGTIPEFEKKGARFIASINENKSGSVYIAFDDIVSIFYYGELLKCFYFKDGKTIIDALKETHDNLEQIENEIKEFDQDLVNKASKYGDVYINVLRASLRQSIGAHKLVEDKKKRKLFLSKECGSDGCIATVDVSYPSSPLYLLYNPELVLGMLYPIFDFAKTEVWEYPFAPHDAGVYPYCNGQFYGVNEQTEGRYQRDIGYQIFDRGVLPMYYLYPKGSNLYKFERQMPIEECGNMLILTAMILKAGYGKKEIKPYFDLLTQWAEYLLEKGLIPENQLCTDDFAGFLDKNINLAIKATVALSAYQLIADALEQKIDAKFREEAKLRAKKISSYKEHIPLTFDSTNETYSLKYNLYPDLILGTNLFDEKVIQKELNYYSKTTNKYGIPLDSREDYTKSDWLIWVASLTEDKEFQKSVIRSIDLFLKESGTKIPFSDWYSTKTADMPLEHLFFRNRTVQGGLFALLLKDKLVKETK
jgi:hypothetical protein